MEKAWLTHKGRVREHNEDSVGLFQSDHGVMMAVVADGMGGHQAGDTASRTAIRVMQRELHALSHEMETDRRQTMIQEAVEVANHEIYNMATQKAECKGMGTTMIASILGKNEVVLAHIGDSRAYLLHKDGLYQLTEDHSLVNVLKQHGEISEEEARVHPHRNVIVRAVGTDEEVEADVIVSPWYKEDLLLLCSDGLYNMVSVDQIGKILTSPASLREKAEQLLEKALDAGGTDNISIVLVKNDGIIREKK
ncbi:Stp1/IreP family PP2C-type Ser/Thr phosphatase [Melghirimyces algeriensis]|uniref:protein-serine/threonine phosphatase n=1 Tax=Melghirimyces algeriensis TaxID=910412 RepID=A0A521BIE6_9BACL|nr:Stp1/IreP family PP2C-type Ser/Thr phosphatase [Melghirimyces algeriensis]SMO46671.1 protein phosphatase [Melghirimyces algeriensis]